MRRLAAVLLVLLLSFCIGARYVDDGAGLLSSEEKDKVESELEKCFQYTGWPVYVHTVSDYGSYGDMESYSDSYSDNVESESFVFVYSPATGEYRIVVVGEDLVEAVGDWGLEYILSYVEPNIDEGYVDLALSSVGYASTDIYDVSEYGELYYIFDHAGLLSSSEIAAVFNDLNESSWDLGMPIVVVTENSTGGKSDMEYADAFQEALGYGSGILLLLNMGERSYWITTMGEGISAFPDDVLYRLEDNFLPYLKSGEYAEAFSVFGKASVKYSLSESDRSKVKFVDIESGEYYVEDEGLGGAFLSVFLVSLVVGLIVGGVGLGSMKRKMKGAVMVDDAFDYAKLDTFALSERRDIFLYSNVTRVKIESSSSSGGHSSSVHHSSSGSSHGGHGGRF